MGSTANSKNAEGIFEPFRVEEVPVEFFAKGERFAIAFQHLSKFGGGSQISVVVVLFSGGFVVSWVRASKTMLVASYLVTAGLFAWVLSVHL